jgi:mono/diheme cytochrome c family protein
MGITFALLIVFGGVFLLEFIVASEAPAATPAPDGAAAYVATVEGLLATADPARGATLVNSGFECHVCHEQGAGRVAPGYDGLAARAATAAPPLTAAAYIYQSITEPGAHVVDGYANAMPNNYPSRLSEQDLADIVAYLLTR